MTEGLEKRLKRLAYRSRHRGTKELDLLIGGFADRHLAGMTPGQLDRFETLLELPEPILTDWLMGRAAPPPDLDNDVVRLLLNFKLPPPIR